MRRLALDIRRLVVSGDGDFDAEAFRVALKAEVAARVREGRLPAASGSYARPSQQPGGGPGGAAERAASAVARGLLQ
jgi:hypothetical protein